MREHLHRCAVARLQHLVEQAQVALGLRRRARQQAARQVRVTQPALRQPALQEAAEPALERGRAALDVAHPPVVGLAQARARGGVGNGGAQAADLIVGDYSPGYTSQLFNFEGFYLGGTGGSNFLYSVLLLVGVGSVVHSMVDFLIALIIAKALSRNTMINALFINANN